MKKLKLSFLFTFIVIVCFGQSLESLNGYCYLHIYPITYANGGVDIYGIMPVIREVFVDKGYGYISDFIDHNQQFKSAIDNPCLILYCTVYHEAPNRNASANLTLTFTNCYKQQVYKTTGKGTSFNYQTYFTQSVKKALEDFSSYNYKFNPELTPKFVYPEVEKTEETEESLTEYYNSNTLDELEGIYKSYQSDYLGYYKIGIKKFGNQYKAIIIETDLNQWGKSEVKAIFESTSLKGLYSVKWYMANKTSYETFASLDNAALLSIEFKDPNTNEKHTDRFIKMYPSINDEIKVTNHEIRATGSGFAITSDGIIATNAHLIEDALKIEISLFNESGTSIYTARVLLKDESNDVALLKIDDSKFTGFNSIPYKIIQTVDIGEDVFTIGYPLNSLMGENFKVTSGIVSSNSGLKDDVRYIQTTTPVQPGNSGGPLFNKDGNVVGLTTAKLNEKAIGTSIENVNYAIKSHYLLNIYNMLPDKKPLPSNSTLENKELKDQIKILKNYVCLIKVY